MLYEVKIMIYMEEAKKECLHVCQPRDVYTQDKLTLAAP
jgi:hypothetical protein